MTKITAFDMSGAGLLSTLSDAAETKERGQTGAEIQGIPSETQTRGLQRLSV